MPSIRKILLSVLPFLPSALTTPLSSRQGSAAPTVTIQNGTISGVHHAGYNQDFFLGVPYAQPPLGDLRFRDPQPLKDVWNGTLEATKYYPECYGYGYDQIGYEQSEDCLVVNIVRPSGMEGQALPIGAWIHGGGFYMGGASDLRYNMSFIVENSVKIGHPIIGLSMAYRLGPWGFMNGEEIQAEGSTNVGMKDQRAVLHWIQENIGAFGGDPEKVTIFGESAGAQAVGIHAIAYGGKDEGLFSGIIGQSGNAVISAYNATSAQYSFDNVTEVVGCGDEDDKLARLRGKDFDTLNKAFNVTGLRFGPSPDGDFIPNSTYDAMINGDFVKVPYMIGANSDEGSGGFGANSINNDSDFRSYLLRSGFDEESAPIIEATYPNIPAVGIPATLNWTLNSTYGYQFKRASALGGDLAFHAGRRLTNQQYALNNVTTYAYRFNTIPYPLPPWIGVAHFQEVAFVFDNTEGLGYADNAKPFTDAPQSYFDLAQLMSSMWASFIATGDPNNHNLVAPHWPLYVNGEGGDPVTGLGGYGKNMVLQANGTGSYVEDDVYRAAGIGYLNSIWGSVLGR